MRSSAQVLNPSEAAGKLGISAKALRLYEQRGLIAPPRTAAGWRVYGPGEMARAAEIVALRALGLSLAEVARVLDGDRPDIEAALAAHQAALEGQVRRLSATVETVHRRRTDLRRGEAPELARPNPASGIAFDLPWPWGGERFTLSDVRPLNYIIGPLGCGKTRLAQRIAERLPSAVFLGVDRLADGGAAARALLDADPALRGRVDQALASLTAEGAARSNALIALLAGLEAEGPDIIIVDMLEQGLDQPTQEALIAHLRRRAPAARPLFCLTRSSAILDLDDVGPDETIIFCPANHSPPTRVAPYRGTPGYEAVETCLASPQVRARTEGVIAWRPQVA